MKFLRIIFFLLVLANSVHCQTNNNVFDLKTLTWFGVDCSNLKCIGTYAQWGNENKLLFDIIPSWNNKIIDKPKKYNLGKTFNNCDIDIDLKIVQKINFDINPDSLVSAYIEPQLLKEIQIENYTKKYISQDRNGWGVYFLAENFNLKTHKAIIDVVIFDISTGKIGLMRRLTSNINSCDVNPKPPKAICTTLKKIRREWNNWRFDSNTKN